MIQKQLIKSLELKKQITLKLYDDAESDKSELDLELNLIGELLKFYEERKND